MGALRELFVTLGLEHDAAGFLSAEIAMKGLELAAELLVEAFKLVGEQLAEAVLGTAEYGEETSQLADRLGMTTDSVQELGFAAATSGSSVEGMRVGLAHLARFADEARQGSDSATEAFARLGVSIYDASGRAKGNEELVGDLAEAFKRLGPSSERTALSMQIFGRSGTELIPLLSRGREALAEVREEARELGIVMSGEDLAAAARFKDGIEALQETARSLRRDLGTPLIEALQPVLTAIVDWVKANRELIKTKLQDFARLVVAAFRLLWQVLRGVAAVVQWLVEHWKLLAVILGSVVLAQVLLLSGALLEQLVVWALNMAAAVAYGAAMVVAGLKAAAAWIAAVAPVVLLTAALVLAALALEDVYGYLTGADSLIGDLGPKWDAFLEKVLKPNEKDPWWLAALKEALRVVTDLEGAFQRFKRFKEATDTPADTTPHRGSFFDYLRDQAPSMPELIKWWPGQPWPGSAPGAPTGVRGGSAPAVNPTFHAQIDVHQQPGQDGGQVATALEEKLDDWWSKRMQELEAASAPAPWR